MSQLIQEKSIITSIFERRLDRKNTFPSFDEVVNVFTSGKKLRIYWGIDPTGTQVHIGHMVPILMLKQLALLGHEIILLIGDFTARIGDPTDKSAVRKVLSKEDVEVNMATYLDQVNKILPKDSYTVRYNSEWLEVMNFQDVISLMSKVTVQQMLVRDMFQKRIADSKPIHMHEFLYPLMQGYDSVVLDVDAEVGGTDQVFNMLMGRDLQRIYHDKEKLVLATELLVSPVTGKKMSKSEGNLIAVTDSPEDIFGKTMASIPDDMIKTVFELCTEVDSQEIEKLEKQHENKKFFKEALAFELVRMFHGNDEAIKAKENFENVFSKKNNPEVMQEYAITGGSAILLDSIIGSGIGGSKSDIKRLFQQHAIKVNGETVEQWDVEVKKGDIIKIGSHQFLKIV